MELLDNPCPECKGAGVVQNPIWQKWFENSRELPPEGHWLHQQPEEVECLQCKGRGYVPTNLGCRLLEFLRRHNT